MGQKSPQTWTRVGSGVVVAAAADDDDDGVGLRSYWNPGDDDDVAAADARPSVDMLRESLK